MQVVLPQYNFLKHSFISIFLTWTNGTSHRRGISKALPLFSDKKQGLLVYLGRKKHRVGVVNFHLLSKHLKEQHILKTLKLVLLNSKLALFFRIRKLKPHHIEIENTCASLMAKQAERKKCKLNRARREYGFHTKVTPYSNMDLYSRNGFQDPQHSFSFFYFTQPASPKCAEEPDNPADETCAMQSIFYDTFSNSNREKSPTNCKINTSSPIVKPSCLSAAGSVQEESWSPGPALHELSSAGAQP